MGFEVPWRCLVPSDAIEPIFAGACTRACEEASGAQVRIAGENEAPATLSDKIVSLSGSVAQKEEACRFILRSLWTSQGIPPDEEGIFVLVVPASVVGAIIGPKGVKIKEIMQTASTDINVGREAIIGMPDNPMVITGTQANIIIAASMSHAVLQELADKDRVREDDFRYIPGRVARPMPRPGPSSVARFLVSRSLAGFIIGRGGQKVRELKEQSGANIQLRSADEETKFALRDEDRVVELRGEHEQRAQAIQALLTEIDQSPDVQQATRLLVPGSSDAAVIERMATAAAPDVIPRLEGAAGGPSVEAILHLDGPVSARIKAIFAILGHIDGEQPRGDVSVRPSSTTEDSQMMSGAPLEHRPEQSSAMASRPVERPQQSPQVNAPRDHSANTHSMNGGSETTQAQCKSRVESDSALPVDGKGCDPGVFRVFQNSSLASGCDHSDLHLLLPNSAVQNLLIPGGYFAEIATGCNVHINVRDQVPPDKVCVSFSGSCAATSLAALVLQWRLWFAAS